MDENDGEMLQLGMIQITPRGFERIEFADINGAGCVLQQSSLADADAIRLGIDGASMHLTMEQIAPLIAHLQAFASVGSFDVNRMPTEPEGLD